MSGDQAHTEWQRLVAELRERLAAGSPGSLGDGDLEVRARRLVRSVAPLADDATARALASAAVADLVGLGPLQPYLADPDVEEVLVNNGGDVWIERRGTMAMAGRLADDVTPRLIERILNPLGRRLDRLSPIVDARLPDGSRLCAVIPPIAVDGPCLALRRFAAHRRTLADFGDTGVTEVLDDLVRRRCNVVISGATSSGKTSLLNVLASRSAAGERIITLEDTAELHLDAAHVLRLEARPPNLDGTGAVTMTDLVRTALRLRPDRLVVGEFRGAEVVDVLAALNTGHDGSLATCHANGPEDALARIEALVLQHTAGWPIDVVREHVARSVDAVVHVERNADGSRGVTAAIEMADRGGAHRPLVVDGRAVSRPERSRR